MHARFGFDELRRFVLTVKKNYRDVPYHNWTHAFAVAHSMYLVIRSGNDRFTALEVRRFQLKFLLKFEVKRNLENCCKWPLFYWHFVVSSKVAFNGLLAIKSFVASLSFGHSRVRYF